LGSRICDGIYFREHAPRHGRVSYFHQTTQMNIHWSNRRRRWEISTPQWPGTITIHATCSHDQMFPVSEDWMEANDTKFLVRTFDINMMNMNPLTKIGNTFLKPVHYTQFTKSKPKDKSTFGKIMDAFRGMKGKKRRINAVLGHTVILKGQEHRKQSEMKAGHEMRIQSGLTQDEIYYCVQEKMYDEFAKIISDYVGDQLIVVCISKTKVRVLCGWDYTQFETNFGVGLKQILNVVTNEINLDKSSTQMIQNGTFVKL